MARVRRLEQQPQPQPRPRGARPLGLQQLVARQRQPLDARVCLAALAPAHHEER